MTQPQIGQLPSLGPTEPRSTIPSGPEDQVAFQELRRELYEEKARFNYLLSELIQMQNKRQQLSTYITSFNEQARSIPKNDSNFSLASLETADEDEKFPIGTYSSQVRAFKIARFKEKRRRYHEKVSIIRDYKGRSQVARTKPRVNGKFVKSTGVNVNQ